MKFLISMNLSLIIMVTFFALPKRLHILEHVFLWMVLVFTITSTTSVIVDNVDFWTLSDKVNLHSTFKLVQMVGLPLLIQLFIERIYSKGKRLVSFFSCLILLLLFESILIWSGIIEHTNWNFFFSFILWVALLLLIMGMHYLFRKQLSKEGVLS
ncbi:hypothetical protein H1D32_22295 [Anaerobacillus sp. CMMVII]|uniref:hypothetical protein n=1 Tax=Anaerobacillus sp. CMMVII TaxID=2755588 RepID=UPI0021B7E213|nr:hypothetical protein [Anaerobacillus sp. CMMVII]MCT8140186.1 hypothetical protein [Anaerobacillus sp. CMMVII]